MRGDPVRRDAQTPEMVLVRAGGDSSDCARKRRQSSTLLITALPIEAERNDATRQSRLRRRAEGKSTRTAVRLTAVSVRVHDCGEAR